MGFPLHSRAQVPLLPVAHRVGESATWREPRDFPTMSVLRFEHGEATVERPARVRSGRVRVVCWKWRAHSVNSHTD